MVNTIRIISNYGLENVLLLSYLVLVFLFWLFIYYKLPKMTWQKNNMVKSISVIGLSVVCWIWFIFEFWMFRAVLLISNYSSYLEDKLYLINLLIYFTLFVVGVIGLINAVKIKGKVTGVTQFLKELMYEVGGKNE